MPISIHSMTSINIIASSFKHFIKHITSFLFAKNSNLNLPYISPNIHLQHHNLPSLPMAHTYNNINSFKYKNYNKKKWPMPIKVSPFSSFCAFHTLVYWFFSIILVLLPLLYHVREDRSTQKESIFQHHILWIFYQDYNFSLRFPTYIAFHKSRHPQQLLF